MIRPLYGLEMEIPAGKLPGFYAQIIHKIGDEVEVYDRCGLIFILNSPEQLDKLVQILAKYNMATETFELYQLPDETQFQSLEDYGFEGIEGNRYVLAHLVSLFRLETSGGTDSNVKLSASLKNDDPSDSWAVIEQLQEYLIAKVPDEKDTLYVLDSTHQDLAMHIAQKYNVSLQFIT